MRSSFSIILFYLFFIFDFLCRFQGTLKMKGVKEMKALLDILELDSSVYVRIQVSWLYGLNL